MSLPLWMQSSFWKECYHGCLHLSQDAYVFWRTARKMNWVQHMKGLAFRVFRRMWYHSHRLKEIWYGAGKWSCQKENVSTLWGHERTRMPLLLKARVKYKTLWWLTAMADAITSTANLTIPSIHVFSIFIPTSITARAHQHQKQPQKNGNSPPPISPVFLVSNSIVPVLPLLVVHT